MIKKLKAVTKVKNKLGIHVRPATYLAKLLQSMHSNVILTYKEKSINARSIMSIMILAASIGSKLVISAKGPDAQQAVDALCHLIEDKFGEEE